MPSLPMVPAGQRRAPPCSLISSLLTRVLGTLWPQKLAAAAASTPAAVADLCRQGNHFWEPINAFRFTLLARVLNAWVSLSQCCSLCVLRQEKLVHLKDMSTKLSQVLTGLFFLNISVFFSFSSSFITSPLKRGVNLISSCCSGSGGGLLPFLLAQTPLGTCAVGKCGL